MNSGVLDALPCANSAIDLLKCRLWSRGMAYDWEGKRTRRLRFSCWAAAIGVVLIAVVATLWEMDKGWPR